MKRRLLWIALASIMLSGCDSTAGNEVQKVQLSEREQAIAATLGAEVVSAYDIDARGYSIGTVKFWIEYYENGKLVERVENNFKDSSIKGEKRLEFLMLSKKNTATHKVDYFLSLAHNGTNYVTAAIDDPEEKRSGLGLVRARADRDDFGILMDVPHVINVTAANSSGSAQRITETIRQDVFENEKKLQAIIDGNEFVFVYRLGFYTKAEF